MKRLVLVLLVLISVLVSSCNNPVEESYLNGDLYKVWVFDKIEPYKISTPGEENRAKEFVDRINVTPIELDFEDGEEGTFKAFFPDLDNEYLISRDFSGKVNFSLREESIYVTFSDVEGPDGVKFPTDFFIKELSADQLMFQISSRDGILFDIYMKPN